MNCGNHSSVSSQIISSMQRIANVIVLIAVFSFCLQPALSYYFKGYYCPAVLISPMRDDATYTPVGMGVVTSKAGFRIHPITGKYDFHSGVDLGAHLNDRVYNLLDGVVTRVGWRGPLGVAVEIYHPYPNVRTICGHLNAYSVLPGQFVQRGRVIGYAGSTGRSTGVHVHYTVIKADTNEYIQPMQYLTLVPRYVKALRTASAKLALQQGLIAVRKNNLPKTPVNSDSADLPDPQKESKSGLPTPLSIQ